jgi:hypothetical protein
MELLCMVVCGCIATDVGDSRWCGENHSPVIARRDGGITKGSRIWTAASMMRGAALHSSAGRGSQKPMKR